MQDALLGTVKFWLDLGVNGLRLDAINFCFHDDQLRSNPGAACGLPASAAKVSTDPTDQRTGADTQFLAPFFMQSIATAFISRSVPSSILATA